MQTFFVAVTCTILAPYLILGLTNIVLTHRKYKIGRKIGMKEAKGISKYGTGIFFLIPPVFVGALLWAFLASEAEALIALSVVIVGLSDVALAIFFVAIFADDDLKQVRVDATDLRDLRELRSLTTYFGKMDGSGKKFREYFGFSAFENHGKNMVFRLKKDTNPQLLLKIAKAYHELVSLERMHKAIPDTYKLNESDKEMVLLLKQQIDELKSGIWEARDVVQSFLEHDENAQFTTEEVANLRKLREMSVRKTEGNTFLHPSMEALLNVQSHPNVSPAKKAEAKELEKHVREILEKDKNKSIWSAEELADANIKTVKLFHGIQ